MILLQHLICALNTTMIYMCLDSESLLSLQVIYLFSHLFYLNTKNMHWRWLDSSTDDAHDYEME